MLNMTPLCLEEKELNYFSSIFLSFEHAGEG